MYAVYDCNFTHSKVDKDARFVMSYTYDIKAVDNITSFRFLPKKIDMCCSPQIKMELYNYCKFIVKKYNSFYFNKKQKKVMVRINNWYYSQLCLMRICKKWMHDYEVAKLALAPDIIKLIRQYL